MDKLGLRATGLKAYRQALADNGRVRVQVSVLNLTHDRLASIDHQIIDGQVDVTSSGDVTRSCEITFSDETRAITFDSDSPANGALFADRMLRVEYGIKVDELDRWVDAPIFTGPVYGLKRGNGTTIVSAQGKESMARAPAVAWETMTVKKGTPKVDAIRRIMRERAGETRFSLPDVKERLPKRVSLGRMSEPWVVCQKIARSMNMQLYYDGRGVLRLRHLGHGNVFTFRDGTGGTVLAEQPPDVTFDVTQVRNMVWVKGGKPKATKRPNETRAEFETRQDKERGVQWYAVANRNHPLSPWRLGRPDAPRRLVQEIDNDQIRSEKDARQRANDELRELLRQHVDVQFGAMVVPHLEVLDPVRLDTADVNLEFRMKEFTIPLHVGGVMTVGSTRNVQTKGRRGRHRHQHHHHGGGR